MTDNVDVSNSPTSVNPDIPVRTLDKGGEQIQVVAIDYGGAGAESLTVPDFATETTLATLGTEATLLNINSALSSGLQATINSDVLGVAVTGQRNNEIELSFFTAFNTDLITNTTASGGSATITGGHARYQTGTSATGAAKGVSVYSCKYRPAHEQYVFFTAAFTTGVANSYQRIGLYDTNNGFYVGYEGTSFGVTLRTGAANTFVARASWNGDPLDGTSGSKFTRGGSPEAINLTYSNLYRIRFAWLGSASIFYEVFSPDGGWITFHTIRIPNSQLDPSIQNPELPITIDIAKTSGASNIAMYTACAAAGTTSDAFPINEVLNEYSLAKLTRSVITGETTAGGGGFVNVKVNPSGALTISLGDIDGVKGQQTMANSLPVVIASNQTAVPVSQSGTWNLNNITGTITLPTGAATETTLAAKATESTLQNIDSKITACNTNSVTIGTQLPSGTNNIGDVDVLTLPNVTLASQTNPFTSAIAVSDNGGSITVDGTIAATQSGTWDITNISGTVSLPTGAATESTLSTLNGKVTACNTGAVTISTALPAGTNNIGDVDVLTLPDVAIKNYSTSSVTSVVSAAVSTSILASNANRRMAIMVNDTDKNAYVKLGATASTTSFSYKLTPGQTLELPIPVYTGAIDAIWDTSPTGSMRVTEIS